MATAYCVKLRYEEDVQASPAGTTPGNVGRNTITISVLIHSRELTNDPKSLQQLHHDRENLGHDKH